MAARLKDVAAIAGVSVRTVSNVVSGAGQVAAETRARVLAAIEETGYRPNLAARNLRQGRTGLIGLAVPEIGSPYFGELAGLLIDAAQKRGWTVLIDQTAGQAERERNLLSGAAGPVLDGLIISPWSVTPDEIALHAERVPTVVLGEVEPGGAADHVAIDNVAAACEATRHLIAEGARRPAALGLQPHLHNRTAPLRLKGYHQALREARMAPAPEREAVVESLHRADGHRAMNALLDLPEPPDAVFCFTDELALGALHAARARGLRSPHDLLVVGFDDTEDGRYHAPTLSTVAPDKREIAERALLLLAARIQGWQAGLDSQHVTARHRLVVRESSTRGGVPAKP
ncbi:LacI family DNA-binding transcriptional regulator [Phaeacidiphilus oryzae]|uniref:LacI family DNA-binding transcriptional regulator n=1 Tax=Phaeacidiphilus oryzae TaxID=348818 RepID=UPI00055DE2C1|nr:LacI family DNA-binding transcriptional regulator [Phaeacidiphilus oryzae]